MGETTVVGPGLTPDWLDKRNGIIKAIDDQLIQGLRRPGTGWTLDELQAQFVEHRGQFVSKVEMAGDVKIYHVVANFANATEAIKACDCPVKWGFAFGRMADVPMVVQPINQRMRIVVPGRVVYNSELSELLPKLVNPIAALGFGFRFPEEQIERPTVTVWRDASGQFWYVCLDVIGGRRCVNVRQHDPDDHWNDDVGFLVGE